MTPDPGYTPDPINWQLINDLATKPHPMLNIRDDDHGHDCCPYVGEVLQSARSAHHLLDLAGVPHGNGYSQHVDVRTYLLLCEVLHLRERLVRIATWHSRETGPAGTVGDLCSECGGRWSCDTHRMATGDYVDTEESDQ